MPLWEAVLKDRLQEILRQRGSYDEEAHGLNSQWRLTEQQGQTTTDSPSRTGYSGSLPEKQNHSFLCQGSWERYL